MADTLRIRSDLLLAITATEPTPDEFKDKPGLAPALRSITIRPGVNEFSGEDAEVYRKWAKANPTFIADDKAVAAGETAGLLSEVDDEEEGDEYGFEPALARASKGDNASAAAAGSTVKDAGPVKADDMAQKTEGGLIPPPSSAPGAPVAAASPATASTQASVAKK